MSINNMYSRIKKHLDAEDEVLASGATAAELQAFEAKVKVEFGAALPEEYLTFLQLVDGFEYNGLQIYGTKNPGGGSDLDLVEMNHVHRESEHEALQHCIVLGSSDSVLFTYDFSSGQFQERDIIGLDDVTEYPSFEKMLKEPLEYTLY